MKLLLALAAIICLAYCGEVLVDDLNSVCTCGRADANDNDDTATSYHYPSIVGFSRNLLVHGITGLQHDSRVFCEACYGQMTFSADVGVEGSCKLRYEGFGGIYPRLDYSNGRDTWLIRVREADAGLGIYASAVANLNTYSGSATLEDSVVNGLEVCIPFGGPQSDFSSVSHVYLELKNENYPGADGSIDRLCPAPRIYCWHEVETSVYSLYTTPISFHCRNLDCYPGSTENFTISFSLPGTVGTLASATCTHGVAPTNIASGLSASFTSIAPGVEVRCDVGAVFSGDGSHDIMATITNDNTNAVYKSTRKGDNSRTVGACVDPVATTVTFTTPPPTMAPTTEPPTTEPPTTLPPTTLPPTTLPPTTLPPTTEAPTTEVPTTLPPTTEVPTTEAPVEPTEAPVEPTEAPVEPTEAPVEPTEAPVEPTEAPTD